MQEGADAEGAGTADKPGCHMKHSPIVVETRARYLRLL